MKMHVTAAVLSLCNLVAAAQEGTDKSSDLATERGPLQILVALIGDPSDEVLNQAEETHVALLKTGQSPVTATYALSLIYTQEQQYDSAVKSLESLSNDAKYAPPIVRLRLYLALERGERSLAEKLVLLLRSQVDNSDSPLLERIDSARLLGGIISTIQPGSANTLSPVVVNETIREMTAAKETKISTGFRQAQSEAAKRREKLNSLVAIPGDKANAEQSLKEIAAEQAAATNGLQPLKASLAATIRENQKAQSELTGQIRLLAKQIRQIEKEWRLETSGRPRQPVRPTEPRSNRPSPPAGNDPNGNANYQRALDAYHSDSRAYDAKLRQYNEEQRTYPQRLQVWQQFDQQRRGNLRNARQKVEAEVATARGLEKERDKKADELRDEVKRQQATLQDLVLKALLLRNIVAGADGQGTRNLLNRPSNYDLLSYPAERQRLLQSTR
jgi:hypothetical protein